MRVVGLLCVVMATVMVVASGCGTRPEPAFVASTPSNIATSTPPIPRPAPSPVVIPAGVVAGVAVFDRQTGTFLEQVQPTKRFRSASLVKVLIALDYLWDRGPRYSIPEADRHNFEIMLRGSDDDAASSLWRKIGGEQAINRMVERLSLRDTRPPSAVGLNGWGSTTLSANDMVRVYRYLLDESPEPVRAAIMDNLRASTPCGTDEYYQSFGIPGAFDRPWTAKQGWWGFGDAPADRCTETEPMLPVPAAVPAFKGATPAMMNGRVLHSTGTVGEDDRLIVVVLTQFPSGTSFTRAYAAITILTRSLPRPEGVRPFPA